MQHDIPISVTLILSSLQIFNLTKLTQKGMDVDQFHSGIQLFQLFFFRTIQKFQKNRICKSNVIIWYAFREKNISFGGQILSYRL